MLTQASMLSFLAVVEKQGITAASKHLGLTPAAISKQIKSLENYLGLKLLFISNKGIKLTDEGAIFYQQAQKIIKKTKDLEQILLSTKEEPEGLLTLFSTLSFGENFLISHLGKFTSLYPKIELEIEFADRIPDVEKEEIDLALGLAGQISEKLIQKKLLTTRYILCAAPTYIETHSSITSPCDLSTHTFLFHSKRLNPNLITFLGHKKDIQVSISSPFKVNSINVLLQLAKEGMGIANLYDFIIEGCLKEGTLVPILSHYEQPPQNLYAFYTSERGRQPKVRAFLNWLNSLLESSPKG